MAQSADSTTVAASRKPGMVIGNSRRIAQIWSGVIDTRYRYRADGAPMTPRSSRWRGSRRAKAYQAMRTSPAKPSTTMGQPWYQLSQTTVISS